MRPVNKQYDVYPRIVRVGQQTEITIRPLFDHVRFPKEDLPSLTLYSVEGGVGLVRWQQGAALSAALGEDGALRVSLRCESEQEYVIVLETQRGAAVELRLFALEQDLFARRPYKGDFHMHTHYSDGKESPAYVAARCRQIGLDFMAITDHGQYAPSLLAIEAFRGVETDLGIYPGEEVHPPENPVHILHLGGSFSVNELFATQDYRREVEQIASALADFPAGVDRYSYASCVWSYEKIRQAGGLGVFCHPYWYSRHSYDVPMYLTDMIMERQPYDALELIGGYHRFEVESNLLQVARYHEERARGKVIPIVGVSDSHGCETGSLFGWYWTVVFSHSHELVDLVDSIKDCWSVAVEALPGEAARAHGPFRLVRYAQFLLREIFPAHDALCLEEGRLLLAHAAGDPQAAAALAGLKGRVQRLYDHLWAG